MMLIVPNHSTHAANPSFSVKPTGILRSTMTDNVEFNFSTIIPKDSSQIAYFKLRTYCDKSIRVSLTGFEGNRCGTAARIEKNYIEFFSLTLDNPTNHSVNFSFKLKAYDKNGKWIHTEKKSFNWN